MTQFIKFTPQAIDRWTEAADADRLELKEVEALLLALADDQCWARYPRQVRVLYATLKKSLTAKTVPVLFTEAE